MKVTKRYFVIIIECNEGVLGYMKIRMNDWIVLILRYMSNNMERAKFVKECLLPDINIDIKKVSYIPNLYIKLKVGEENEY